MATILLVAILIFAWGIHNQIDKVQAELRQIRADLEGMRETIGSVETTADAVWRKVARF